MNLQLITNFSRLNEDGTAPRIQWPDIARAMSALATGWNVTESIDAVDSKLLPPTYKVGSTSIPIIALSGVDIVMMIDAMPNTVRFAAPATALLAKQSSEVSVKATDHTLDEFQSLLIGKLNKLYTLDRGHSIVAGNHRAIAIAALAVFGVDITPRVVVHDTWLDALASAHQSNAKHGLAVPTGVRQNLAQYLAALAGDELEVTSSLAEIGRVLGCSIGTAQSIRAAFRFYKQQAKLWSSFHDAGGKLLSGSAYAGSIHKLLGDKDALTTIKSVPAAEQVTLIGRYLRSKGKNWQDKPIKALTASDLETIADSVPADSPVAAILSAIKAGDTKAITSMADVGGSDHLVTNADGETGYWQWVPVPVAH